MHPGSRPGNPDADPRPHITARFYDAGPDYLYTEHIYEDGYGTRFRKEGNFNFDVRRGVSRQPGCINNSQRVAGLSQSTLNNSSDAQVSQTTEAAALPAINLRGAPPRMSQVGRRPGRTRPNASGAEMSTENLPNSRRAGIISDQRTAAQSGISQGVVALGMPSNAMQTSAIEVADGARTLQNPQVPTSNVNAAFPPTQRRSHVRALGPNALRLQRPQASKARAAFGADPGAAAPSVRPSQASAAAIELRGRQARANGSSFDTQALSAALSTIVPSTAVP